MWWWKMSYSAADSKNKIKKSGNLIWCIMLDKLIEQSIQES